jgi:hypothetical protein
LKTECTHIKKLLSAYMDGMLDASEMSDVREHLHACTDCSREHEALRSLIMELGNIPAVKSPDDFLIKVHEKIERHSFLDRIWGLFDFTRTRITIEAAAFALTAVLILSIFYFFPSQEKITTEAPPQNVAELKTSQGNPAVQTAGNSPSIEQSVKAQLPAVQTPEKRIPIKLALSLMTTQTTSPIPSQSVSYGNSEVESSGENPGLPADEDESAHKILPIEINSKIDEMIKSVGGTLISRDYNSETGYPSHVALEIPVIGYSRFIAKIENLGILQTKAPSLPKESRDSKIVIQIELSN